MSNYFFSKKLLSKLPVHPILCIIVRSITYFYARHAPIILTHHTTGQLEKTQKVAITHIHTNTDIVTTKNGKHRRNVREWPFTGSIVYKFTSSFHRTMFLWMFIFIYTSFITSYNQEFITFSRLFTGWRLLLTTTSNTPPPHFEAGGAVSVPFMLQAYTILILLHTINQFTFSSFGFHNSFWFSKNILFRKF